MRCKARGGRERSSSSSSGGALAFLAVFSCASCTVANASSHHHQHGVGGAASISASSSSGGSGNVVVPITPDNFLGAIAECLEEDKDGACPKYGQESKYGEMKDWNVSEVTDMDYGFHKQESFNGDLSKWDTSSVTSMREMFSGARDFTGSKKGLGNWDTSNVEDMGSMFSEASNFNGKGLAKWNVGKVKDMSFMLKDAVAFKEDLSAWRPSECKTAYGMFQNAVEFEADVKDWGLSVTADTKDMFLGAANFLGRFTCAHPLNGPPSTCEDENKVTLGKKSSSITKMKTLHSSRGDKSKKKAMEHVAAMGSDEDEDELEEEVTTVASEDTTHTSSSSIFNTKEVDTDGISDSVDSEDEDEDSEDEDEESSVPSNVSYPHTEAEESSYSSSSTTTTSSTSYASSSSLDSNVIDCSDGGCPEGNADSINDLNPEDKDVVKDALAIDTSLNKDSPFVTSEKTLDEFTGNVVEKEDEEIDDDDDDDDEKEEDSDSEEDESSEDEDKDEDEDEDQEDDDDTVEVSKDQIEDLVEDKEAFDKEFERFMSASKMEDEIAASVAAEATAKTGDDEEIEEASSSSSKKSSSHLKKQEENEENEESETVVSASMTNPLRLKKDGTVSKKHSKIPGVSSSSTYSLSQAKKHRHVMDEIDDEDVDVELERLKRKLDRLQSETPEEIQAEHKSRRHKQLDDNSFYRAISKCIIESAAGLCVEYGAVTRFGMMPDWDVSKVSTMTHAFQHYEEFNADLSRWNTKSVTDMSFMFYDAKSFNSDISGWNVAGVTNMKQMFRGAKSLNQDVVSWFANRPSSEMKRLNIDGIFDGAEKIEAAYECGLSKFLDNAMDMCRFANAARSAKASAKSAAKSGAKASAKASAKIGAKSGAKASARASRGARDASGAELGSSRSLPRLGWNLPREEASSSTEGIEFATLYVCAGMAMIAVAIRAKRESIVHAIESHFYSSPLDSDAEEDAEEAEEEKENVIISHNTKYGTLSEEESLL
jgi:surface protein